MLRTATICALGLSLLLTAAEPDRSHGTKQAREFFFQDFFLDPWKMPAGGPPAGPNAAPAESPASLAAPTAPANSWPPPPALPGPWWDATILLLALAALLLITAGILPWHWSDQLTQGLLLWRKRRQLHRLRQKYRQQEPSPACRQALKATLGLPPGATDQDIIQALQYCSYELPAVLRHAHDRFR
jgi:hypothetical protein